MASIGAGSRSCAIPSTPGAMCPRRGCSGITCRASNPSSGRQVTCNAQFNTVWLALHADRRVAATRKGTYPCFAAAPCAWRGSPRHTAALSTESDVTGLYVSHIDSDSRTIDALRPRRGSMTHEFDLTVRNGTVVTASDTSRCDVGVRGGRIIAMEVNLPAGRRDLDAAGHLVLPGGVDSHCHVEQLSSMGIMCADDFYSASVAAAFGGTTTIIPFASQHKGNSLVAVVDGYAKRAVEK